MPASSTTKPRPLPEKAPAKKRSATRPIAAQARPGSRVTTMLDEIRARGDKLTSDINALLVRLG